MHNFVIAQRTLQIAHNTVTTKANVRRQISAEFIVRFYRPIVFSDFLTHKQQNMSELADKDSTSLLIYFCNL